MTQPISFQLLAPNNPDVSLLGSWNQWQPHPMRKGEDGHWRAEIALEDGEYTYVFEVVSVSPSLNGHKVRLPDPRALEWTNDDKTILRIRDGKITFAGYTWQHEDAPLPANEQLVIYELHVGDFSGGEGDEMPGERPTLGGGTFHDAIEKLDYLVDLGINAIELMPVTAGPPGYQLGYSQRSFFALNSSYGSAQDFAQFVDACHARGIRVIHDSVYNHMATDAILALIDFEYWFFKENPDEFDFGPKLNYEAIDQRRGDQPVKAYTLDSIRLWMQEFHLDGIRFDYARALSFDLLSAFRDLFRASASPRQFFAIGESIPENPTIVGEDGPMDAAWTQALLKQIAATALTIPYRDQLPFDMDALSRAFDCRVNGYAKPHQAIIYLESHDESRLMTVLEGNPNLTREARFRRAKLAAALLLTAPGIPMLWMGQEFGESGLKPERSQPLRWRLRDEPDHRTLWQHYRTLIHLRTKNPALYSNSLRLLHADRNDLVLVFLRWSEDKHHHILVIANVQDSPVDDFELDTSQIPAGQWRDALSDFELKVGRSKATLSLAPSQVMLLCQSNITDA